MNDAETAELALKVFRYGILIYGVMAMVAVLYTFKIDSKYEHQTSFRDTVYYALTWPLDLIRK